MGLLDDAIREHLELKRLRGADPGDVAREEDAALGRVHRRDEPEEPEPAAPHQDHIETTRPDESLPQAVGTHPQSHSSAGQETVEINMEAELAGSGPEHGASSSVVDTAPVAHHTEEQASSADSLEWEMPGDHRVGRDTAREGGSETEGGLGSDLEQGVDPPVEDVLEETPDFLRDTPEQERLWFEQRPPRDFDFNE
jgi:hypothetical protein